MKLIQSHPKLSEDLISELEKILYKRFDYPALPNDYKSFLLKNNGGYVVPGYIEDTDDKEHTQTVVLILL